MSNSEQKGTPAETVDGMIADEIERDAKRMPLEQVLRDAAHMAGCRADKADRYSGDQWHALMLRLEAEAKYEPPTAEQQQTWQREADEKRVADEKALTLLREVLDEKQREQMEKERCFTVESKTSKRRYRVRTDKGRHGNIEEIDQEGRALRRLCCAPGGPIPEADALLGQKLFLEHAEEEFLNSANVTQLVA